MSYNRQIYYLEKYDCDIRHSFYFQKGTPLTRWILINHDPNFFVEEIITLSFAL